MKPLQTAAVALFAATASAQALVPEAERALDCAAVLIVLGVDPLVAQRSLGRALLAEMAETGAYAEHAMPRIQVAFASRVTEAAALEEATAEARRRTVCPAPA